MIIKSRFEFKSKKEMLGWMNISGDSHLENPDDKFVKPIKWGLFRWNENSFYPIENAISIHDKEVLHNELVCRPVEFL
jgi:hypothetical protein